jgi:hypothetical protein
MTRVKKGKIHATRPLYATQTTVAAHHRPFLLRLLVCVSSRAYLRAVECVYVCVLACVYVCA